MFGLSVVLCWLFTPGLWLSDSLLQQPHCAWSSIFGFLWQDARWSSSLICLWSAVCWGRSFDIARARSCTVGMSDRTTPAVDFSVAFSFVVLMILPVILVALRCGWNRDPNSFCFYCSFSCWAATAFLNRRRRQNGAESLIVTCVCRTEHGQGW